LLVVDRDEAEKLASFYFRDDLGVA